MRPFVLAVLSLVIFPLSVVAQDSSADASWAGVSRLAQGTEIRVFLAGGKTVRGFFQNANQEGIAVNATNSQETLARKEIRRVQLKRPSHRGRNTLLGLGIGTGTGLAIGAVADSRSRGGLFLGRDAGKIVFAPMGTIVGTVIGVALPTGGWRDVYRVR